MKHLTLRLSGVISVSHFAAAVVSMLELLLAAVGALGAASVQYDFAPSVAEDGELK